MEFSLTELATIKEELALFGGPSFAWIYYKFKINELKNKQVEKECKEMIKRLEDFFKTTMEAFEKNCEKTVKEYKQEYNDYKTNVGGQIVKIHEGMGDLNKNVASIASSVKMIIDGLHKKNS